MYITATTKPTKKTTKNTPSTITVSVTITLCTYNSMARTVTVIYKVELLSENALSNFGGMRGLTASTGVYNDLFAITTVT